MSVKVDKSLTDESWMQEEKTMIIALTENLHGNAQSCLNVNTHMCSLVHTFPMCLNIKYLEQNNERSI